MVELLLNGVDKVEEIEETKLGSLSDFLLIEKDLGYSKNQNVLLSCTRDGCQRISYCSCDCNDGWI